MKSLRVGKYLTKNEMFHFTRFLSRTGLALLMPLAAWALDEVDPAFAPVIRGPGTVRAMAWHPESELLYVSVSGDKLNGQLLTTSLVRFDATGDWDESYAPSINGTVSHLTVLADGKIVIAGSFTAVDGHVTRHLARVLSDGTVDTTFAVSTNALPSSPTALAVGSDGTIYVGTSGYPYTTWTPTGYVTVWPKLLYKVSTVGVMDTAFEPEFGLVDDSGSSYPYFGATLAVNALWITPTGDILAGGNFTQVNGSDQNYLAKLSPTGVLDTTYQAHLGYTEPSPYYGYFGSSALGVSALTDASDGNVYVGGTFNTVNDYAQTAVARLNADGSCDPAFRVNFSSPYSSANQASVSRIVKDSTGRLVLVGSFEGVDGVAKSRVARVDAQGRLDVSFSTNFGHQDHAVMLPDDAIAFGRTGSLASNGIVQPAIGRVSAEGVVDAGFRPDLRKRRYPDWIAARPNQGPIIGSIWIKEINGSESSGGTAALGTDGAADASFAATLAINGTVNASLVLPDGRILLGGSFTTVGGLSRPRLALVEADGTPVTSFDLGTGPGSDVRLLKLLPSGKVLVGGYFTDLNGEPCQHVALLDLSALTAGQGLVVEEIIEARYGTDLLYADVKTRIANALSGGTINLPINTTSMGGDPSAGSTRYLTVRFRTNRGERTTKIRDYTTLKLPNIAWDSGLIDRNFRPQHTESLSLTDAAEQSDGKILLLGSFSTFAGRGVPRLARLSPDGTLDTTFLPHGQFSSFYPDLVRVDLQDRIYIGGSSMSLTGSSTSRQIYRLSPDGVVDSNFVCPAFLSTVEDILVTPDGSVWCAGSFYSSTAGERKRVARLLPSGLVDTRFDAGESSSSTINVMKLEAPNKLWIAGSFTSVQGATRDGMALLNLSSGIAPLAQVSPRSIKTDEGKTVRFDLSDLGSGETYTWLRNGLAISEANGPSLTISGAEPIDTGTYTAQVVNSAGQTFSTGLLTVQEAGLETWLTARGIPTTEAAADHDGDGMSNEAEYLARTNPSNSSSIFTTRMEADTANLLLRWDSYPGRNYLIEESDDLVTWDILGMPVAGDGTEKTVEIPFTAEDSRLFWRVRVSK